MSLEDAPLNADDSRTWDALIEAALAREGAVTDGGGEASRAESTPRRRFLRRGEGATRTGTPRSDASGGRRGGKKSGGEEENGRWGNGGMGTPGGRKGSPRDATPRRLELADARESPTSPTRRSGMKSGLFENVLNVQPSTMEAWRAHKSKSAQETRAFEELEKRVREETRTAAATNRSPRGDERKDPRVAVVRDFVSSPTPEEEEARAAFERAKANLKQDERRFAEERAAWEAQQRAAEEAFNAECEEIRRQFKREKAAFMREMETRMTLPTKEERNESKFLKEQLERNESEFKAERQRAKLTVDRLRQQIVDLTNEVSELRMEKRLLEEKCQVSDRLRETSSVTTTPQRALATLDSPASSQPQPGIVSMSPRPSGMDATASIAPRTLSVHDPVPSVSMVPSLTAGVVREREHEDGRVERHFADGRRIITFPNGTAKEIVQLGASASLETIYFINGDVKRTHPSGLVEYYYSDVETWHTTHPSGDELYHFIQTNQVELHRDASDGTNREKEILFPDGTLRRIYPDGREEDAYPA